MKNDAIKMRMNMDIFKPINDEPAALIKVRETGERLLMIADLHIGIEYELRAAGLNIPSQTHVMEKRILDLCRQHKPDRIIVIGDVKHTVPAPPHQPRAYFWGEFMEIPKLLGSLGVPVDICLGNHDGGLGEILEESRNVRIHPSSGFRIGNTGFFHGHAWPAQSVAEAPRIITAHAHPTMVFSDEFGHRYPMQCWVRSRMSEVGCRKYEVKNAAEVVMMPAFNPFCGGGAVNEKGLLGVLFDNEMAEKESAEIYLMDGTFVGKLGKTMLMQDKTTP